MKGKKSDRYNIAHCFDEKFFIDSIERVRQNRFCERFADEIVVSGLENLAGIKESKKVGKERKRILYASNHKSHIDYVLLTYIIATNNMLIPRIAAGQNLLIWPLDKIFKFRKFGAFSVDRANSSYQYLKEFYLYVRKIIANGENILFFPEGGRSYDGQLKEPKSGLVGAVLDAVKTEGIKVDVVPIYVDYDRTAESEIFPLLEKAKNYTLIGKPLYYLLDGYAIGKRYFSAGRNGNAYIRFGCPVDINKLGRNRKEIADEIMEQIKALKESAKKLN